MEVAVIHQRLSLLGMFLLITLSLVACATTDDPAEGRTVHAPDGKGGIILRAPTTDIETEAAVAEPTSMSLRLVPNTVSPAPPHAIISGAILYHGGPVMLGTTTVYRIFYGWPGDFLPNSPPFHTAWQMQEEILGFDQSSYYNINAGYTDGSGNHVSNSLHDGGALYTPLSNTYGGTNISDASVLRIVTDQIAARQLPVSANTVYMVVTGPGVQETSGFCSSYCGWHSHATYQGVDVKYAFIGDVAMCPQQCTHGRFQEGLFDQDCPSGDCEADGMANVVAHELSETVTDPDLNAWYDAGGNENGDKCNFVFGPAIGGSIADNNTYDFFGGGAPFEIQKIWVVPNGGCAMSR